MTPLSSLRADAVCQRTLDHLAALVRVWTPDEGVVYVNHRWRELTGTTLDDNTGDGWLRYVHDEDRGRVEATFAPGAGEAPSQTSYRVWRHDGHALRVTDCTTPWTEDTTDALLGRVHTVTLHEPSPADEERSRSMSKWAHELRGPLNAILGWSDLLSAGDAAPDVVLRGLQAIANNARQQAQIIRRMTES
jgi:PAS domain S-box-containing protein